MLLTAGALVGGVVGADPAQRQLGINQMEEERFSHGLDSYVTLGQITT